MEIANNTPFIPFHLPSIGEEEIREVEATLRSGWLTTGPRTAQFEEEFRRYTRAEHAIAVNSASAGLHLALAALEIGPGDEVITTPLTFCSTVHAILHVGARPVLADVGPDGNIDPESIERRVTPRTRAILPVHFAGLPCDMDAIWNLARRHSLAVVEDAAHAVGACYDDGSPVGSSSPLASDAVVFSFYATKNLTTGEGGMITTPSQDLEKRIRTLALHGLSRDAWNRYSKEGSWHYDVVECGFKYNLSDIQSAIGVHQLRKVEEFTRTRARYAAFYQQLIGEREDIELPRAHPRRRHAWHLYVVRLRLEMLRLDRSEFIEELRRRGVGCSVHFIPIPLHSCFADLAEYPCPRAMDFYRGSVSLPLYPAMTERQLRRVSDCVVDVLQRGALKHAATVA